MRRVTHVMGLIMVLACTMQVHAGGLYAGGDISRVDHDEDGLPGLESNMLGGRAGYEFNEYFAVEARAAIGTNSDPVAVGNTRVRLEIDRYYGLYGKLNWPVTYRLRLHTLAGLVHMRVTTASPNIGLTATDDDFSFGAGIDYLVTDQLEAGFEWLHLVSGDAHTSRAISFGARWYFY